MHAVKPFLYIFLTLGGLLSWLPIDLPAGASPPFPDRPGYSSDGSRAWGDVEHSCMELEP